MEPETPTPETMSTDLTVEEMFDQCINVIKTKLATEIKLCDRADLHVNIRNQMVGYFRDEDPGFEVVREKCIDVTFLYEKMISIVSKMTFNDFGREDFEDPFKDLIPLRTQCDNEAEIFDAALAMEVVRPYAEQLFRINRLVLDEVNGK